MNPVFVFLVILVAVMIWALLSFAYKSIGGAFGDMVNDVTKEIRSEEKEKENVKE